MPIRGLSPITTGATTQLAGFNSVATKMYDIAVYRSDTVVLKQATAYLSQSSGGVTVTDHCGLAVEIERKSATL